MSDIKLIKHGVPVRFGKAGEAPASPENGMIYYDTSTELFKVYENGAWEILSSRDYADSRVAGFDIKESCEAATVEGLTATYANGTSGVGATLTGAGALPSIDGASLSVGDRVLVRAQATAAHNGIYEVSALSPFVLTRAVDFDQSAEVNGGEFVFIKQGTTFGNCAFVCISSSVTFGSTAISFTQISGTARTLQQYYATGNQITTGDSRDVIIEGSEKLEITASNGMEISGALSAGETLLSSASVTNAMDAAAAKFSISNAGNIRKLNNVTVSFPTSASQANYALVNDGSGNLSFGNLAVSNLNDVGLAGLTSGDYLKYDSATGNWVREPGSVVASADKVVLTDAEGKLDTSLLQFSGLDLNNNVISGISSPIVSSDLANKAYVDSVSLQALYNQDVDGLGAIISTDSSDGDLIIAGSEKLHVTADSGLDVAQILSVSGSMVAGSMVAGNGSMSVSALGDLGKIKGVSYVFPAAQATGSNYTLVNDGSGNLSWGQLKVSEMNDALVSTASNDEIIQWNGSNWVNVSAVTSGSSSRMMMTNEYARLADDALKYNVDFGGNVLSNILAPVVSTDAVPKYVADNKAADSSSGTGSVTLQLAYGQDIDGSDAVITTSSVDGILEIAGSESFLLSAAKGFLLADNADATKFSKVIYKHELALSANQSNIALSDLTFDSTVHQGCLIEYRIKDDTSGASRIGLLLVSTDGTNTTISDSFAETSALGVSWSVGLADGDVEVRYTTNSTSKKMSAKIKYLA